MENSQSVIDDINQIDGISNYIGKDLPASQSTTGSIPDGDDDERNTNHQTDSSTGVILSTNVRITSIFQM